MYIYIHIYLEFTEIGLSVTADARTEIIILLYATRTYIFIHYRCMFYLLYVQMYDHKLNYSDEIDNEKCRQYY